MQNLLKQSVVEMITNPTVYPATINFGDFQYLDLRNPSTIYQCNIELPAFGSVFMFSPQSLSSCVSSVASDSVYSRMSEHSQSQSLYYSSSSHSDYQHSSDHSTPGLSAGIKEEPIVMLLLLYSICTLVF